jgi:hypothetical protein
MAGILVTVETGRSLPAEGAMLLAEINGISGLNP